MMKHKTLRILSALLALFCLLALAGCSSTPDAPDEVAIMADLNCSEETIVDGGMTVIHLKITKRQTTPEDKVDLVWVEYTAASDAAEYTNSALLTYGLYNEGWLLDSIEEDGKGSFVSTLALDPAPVEAYLEQMYRKDYTLREMSAGETTAVYIFDHILESDVVTIQDPIVVTYRATENGWSSAPVNTTNPDPIYTWKLIGEWEGENEGEKFWIKFHEVSDTHSAVVAEYDFGGSVVSNGWETLTIENQDFWDEELESWVLVSEGSSWGPVEIHPFGARYTDAGEGSGLIAESDNTHCWLTRK